MERVVLACKVGAGGDDVVGEEVIERGGGGPEVGGVWVFFWGCVGVGHRGG